MKTTLAGLTGIVMGACLLMAPTDSIAQRGRRFNNPSPPPATQTQKTNPVIQIYNTRIEIDDNKKKIFKDYLETRVRISSEISECLLASYEMGRMHYQGMAEEVSRHVIYKSALEALESGDDNIYDIMLKNTAWRSDILIGTKKDVLKKNLDSRYGLAKQTLGIVDAKYKSAATTKLDLLRAEGTVSDLRFLYDIFGIPLPESKPKEPAQQKESPPEPEMPKMPEIPGLPPLPK